MDSSDPNNKMDYSDGKTTRNKVSTSPSLSNITEEMSGAAVSDISSSPASSRKSDMETAESGKSDIPRRKLFTLTNDIDYELSSGSSYESPPKDRSLMQWSTPSKKKKMRFSSKESRDENTTKKKCLAVLTPVKLTGGDSCQPVFKWEGENVAVVARNENDPFDSLFLGGIFNNVQPTVPSFTELQMIYVNETSDEDEEMEDLNKRAKRIKLSSRKRPRSKSAKDKKICNIVEAVSENQC